MPVINKRFLDGVQPTGKVQVLRDDTLPGFGVQVTPKGSISFCLTYSVGPKSLRKVIGKFGVLTVDQARKLALQHLAALSQGTDPFAVVPTSVATIVDLYAVWMSDHVDVMLKPQTANNYRATFETHCRRRFGHLDPSAVEPRHIAEVHKSMKSTPSAANHMLRTMNAMLGWAASQRLVTFPHGNPARGHRLYKENPSDRILSVPEIRAFVKRLPSARMNVATQRLLMLELLLGQRSSEVAGMRRADVDLVAARWTIRENKSDRPHVVPLPPWAREIIAAALSQSKSRYVFPSPVANSETGEPMSIEAHAMATALRRAQRPRDDDEDYVAEEDAPIWVFDFRDREDRPNPISPHDLRRTCSSYLEVLGFGDFIRGAILNHSQRRNVTAKHYSAADLLKLKRTALLQWEAAVRRIVAGEDPFASVLEDDRAEEARVLGLAKA
jgi:integrase